LMEDAFAARTRAEEAHAALRESEAKYRLLAEHSADWIFWLGSDECFKYVSPACMLIAGHTPEEFIADHGLMVNIIHPDDRAKYRQHLTDNINADVHDLEMRIMHKDGSVRWINNRCKTVQGEHGEFMGWHGANRQITLHKLSEQALQMESEKNLALLRNASDGIHILDTDGNIIEASNSFCEMLGYSREEIIGMNVSQWDAGFADADDLVRNLKQQFEQPIRSQFETRHRRKDGTVFDAEVSGFPVELAGIQLLFNSSRDIDLRKQTEERLHLQSAALETAANAIVITDTEAVIQWANPAFSALTGYSLAEAVGKCPKDLI